MSDDTHTAPAGIVRLPWDAITYVHCFYDGPLAGLCAHDGRIHYFAPDPDAPLGDRLRVYPLTDAEIEQELTLKALFEQTVGTHWSRDLPAEQRRIIDAAGSAEYEARVAATFPDLDCDDARARYTSSGPVAIIE